VDGESPYPIPRSERLGILYASYVVAIIFIYDAASIMSVARVMIMLCVKYISWNCLYKSTYESRMEAESNTSTATLRVAVP
jgi:uncharacterized membrane protein